jgi:RecA-family ATPase
MESIEKARKLFKKWDTFEGNIDGIDSDRLVIKIKEAYEQALSDQRGEIIDAVVKIANENRNYKWSFDEFIQAIEKLRR